MSIDVRIPFLDLASPHRALEGEILSALRQILRSGAFVGGPAVEAFESEFAGFCQANHCIGVSSGTDALRFALIASDVRPGDIVLTVPNTFIATVEAISQAGAYPAFIDVREDTCTMDPALLRRYIDRDCRHQRPSGKLYHKRTGRPVTAVVPVHIYGLMADLDPILEIAEEYKLSVIEDACQAHGAEYLSTRSKKWMRAGAVGRAAAFSFYPGKNLGACGEAGAVTTQDGGITEKIKMLRDHGQKQKYYHACEGYNGRLDAMQAAILKIKLPCLAAWNAQRREAAQRYDELFRSSGLPIALPIEPSGFHSSYHLYVIRTDRRDELKAYLEKAGIGTQIHYPVPLHLQKAYEHLGWKNGDFPVAERLSTEILSLPLYPHLTAGEQEQIVGCIAQFISTIPAASLAEAALIPQYAA